MKGRKKMISISNLNGSYDIRGLSTDSKPTTDILNGSTFIEMDTGKVFMFNGASSTWVEL